MLFNNAKINLMKPIITILKLNILLNRAVIPLQIEYRLFIRVSGD